MMRISLRFERFTRACSTSKNIFARMAGRTNSRFRSRRMRIGDRLEGLAKTSPFCLQNLRYNDGNYPSCDRFPASHLKRSRNMIEVLLGSKNAERVLIYIHTRQEGYAREIARFYNTDLK